MPWTVPSLPHVTKHTELTKYTLRFQKELLGYTWEKDFFEKKNVFVKSSLGVQASDEAPTAQYLSANAVHRDTTNSSPQ